MKPELHSCFKELIGRLILEPKPQWVIDAVIALHRFCETGEIPRSELEQPKMEISQGGKIQ